MILLIGGTLAYLFLPAPWWVLVVVLLAGVEVFEVFIWLRWRKRRALSGIETLVGERGVLLAGAPGLSGRPRVRIRGTTYPARPGDARPGDPVEVARVDGMTLVLRRTEA